MFGEQWVNAFNKDFRRRFASLLGSAFRGFGCRLAQSVLAPQINFGSGAPADTGLDGCEPVLTPDTIDSEYNSYDLRRLESYARNMVDHHVISDLLPVMARQFFAGRLPIESGISAVQCAVFIGVGLQQKTIDEVAEELDVPINQLLALFNKLIRKLSAHLRSLKEAQVGAGIPKVCTTNLSGKLLSCICFQLNV